MKHLLDTNIIIYAVGGCDPAVGALEQAVASEWVGYSAITRLELFGYPDLTPEEEAALGCVVGELEEVAVTSRVVDHSRSKSDRRSASKPLMRLLQQPQWNLVRCW